jgi:PadR family transcriptional regulator, regulatory protein PadR
MARYLTVGIKVPVGGRVELRCAEVLYLCRLSGVKARSRSFSKQTLAVLQALAARPEDWRYGYELSLEVGLKSGSLYPILMRLCDAGLLESMWQAGPPAGRPPRHLYRLSGAGLAALAATGTAERSTTWPVPFNVASSRG